MTLGNPHDIGTQHTGLLTDAQIAGGTADVGEVPVSNGDGTRTWGSVSGGGGGNAKTVRVATTTNGTLATAFENGDTVDGVVLATGDRILLKNQTTQADRGIYTVNASGAPTRATDFDSEADALGAFIIVREGTVNADSAWLLTTNGPITIGSTSLTFVQQLKSGSFGFSSTANQVFSPDGTHGVSVRNTQVSLYSLAAAGDKPATSPIQMELGPDTLFLAFGEKDANTIQAYPNLPSVDVELADTSSGQWYHRDNAGVFREFQTMESRKGSGTATITSGNTSISVTHGAGYTPGASDIVVTPTNNPTNAPGNFWISNIGATTFDINVRNDPGSNCTFAWRVDR